MKILTTGNPKYGLATAIQTIIGGDFASRSSGVDLETDEGMDAFVGKSIEYSQVILNCYTEKMNNYSQSRLLHKLYIKWVEEKKSGHIICIGSISDHINKEQPWLKYLSYSAEKLALKQLCQTINHNRGEISPNIRCTYISLGHMHTPYVDKLHPNEKKLQPIDVAKLIKWIAECPECVEEITITKDKNHG
jgi:NAD(P)-dependent dehydrogenase (short-subunit alcohol dehydrogenase family)